MSKDFFLGSEDANFAYCSSDDFNRVDLFDEPQDKIIYNATQAISQNVAPIYGNCTLGFWKFADGTS